MFPWAVLAASAEKPPALQADAMPRKMPPLSQRPQCAFWPSRLFISDAPKSLAPLRIDTGVDQSPGPPNEHGKLVPWSGKRHLCRGFPQGSSHVKDLKINPHMEPQRQ